MVLDFVLDGNDVISHILIQVQRMIAHHKYSHRNRLIRRLQNLVKETKDNGNREYIHLEEISRIEKLHHRQLLKPHSKR